MLSEMTYDGELSGAAYVLLAAVLVLVVGGLSWCFYKALAGTNGDAAEQLADDV